MQFQYLTTLQWTDERVNTTASIKYQFIPHATTLAVLRYNSTKNQCNCNGPEVLAKPCFN